MSSSLVGDHLVQSVCEHECSVAISSQHESTAARGSNAVHSGPCLEALVGLVAWSPCMVNPFELAHLSSVDSTLHIIVAEACTNIIRGTHIDQMVVAGLAVASHTTRSLNHAQLLARNLHPTIVASENYSVNIDIYGRLLIWGCPGWLEPRETVHVDNERWPPLAPTVAKVCILPSTNGSGKVRQDPKIKAVVSSRHAVFALTEHGELLFTQVRRAFGNAYIELHPLIEMRGVIIRHISTRYGQAFAISDEGAVYAWGMKSGDLHQPLHQCSMGFGEISTIMYPRQIPFFDSMPIRSIAVGVSHTVFVSISGEAYSVGCNEKSKLGLGEGYTENQQVTTPQKICFSGQVPSTIVSAAAGAKHSLFLSSDGKVWGCGYRKSGALPTKHKFHFDWSTARQPLLLDTLFFCTSIAAGIAVSFFIDECGKAYFTGEARQTHQPFNRPLGSDASVPWQIPGLRDVEQVSVSMEMSLFQWEHVLFTHRDGTLSGWGHMAHGELVAGTHASKGCPSSGEYKALRNSVGFRNSIAPI